MQKLRMDIAELHVETFSVIPSPDDGRGTVLAHQDTYSVCFGPETFLATYDCGPTSLQTQEWCSAFCEPGTGPGWSQWCPEEEAP